MTAPELYCSMEFIADAIKDAGYKAEVEELNSGRKVIRSAASGSSFYIYTYGPDDDSTQIQSIQFAYAVERKVDPAEINKWNSAWRFGKAYLDEDGDLNVEWDVIISYSSRRFVAECINCWDQILASVKDIPEIDIQ